MFNFIEVNIYCNYDNKYQYVNYSQNNSLNIFNLQINRLLTASTKLSNNNSINMIIQPSLKLPRSYNIQPLIQMSKINVLIASLPENI